MSRDTELRARLTLREVSNASTTSRIHHCHVGFVYWLTSPSPLTAARASWYKPAVLLDACEALIADDWVSDHKDHYTKFNPTVGLADQHCNHSPLFVWFVWFCCALVLTVASIGGNFI
jgi:hypothetical protein